MDKQTFKDRIKEAKEEFLILSDEDAEEACHFVAKLIQLKLDYLAENEPYATEEIRKLERMESDVHSFFDYSIQGLLDDDNFVEAEGE